MAGKFITFIMSTKTDWSSYGIKSKDGNNIKV